MHFHLRQKSIFYYLPQLHHKFMNHTNWNTEVGKGFVTYSKSLAFAVSNGILRGLWITKHDSTYVKPAKPVRPFDQCIDMTVYHQKSHGGDANRNKMHKLKHTSNIDQGRLRWLRAPVCTQKLSFQKLVYYWMFATIQSSWNLRRNISHRASQEASNATCTTSKENLRGLSNEHARAYV